MPLEYKFVELSIVTDETLEEAVNTWIGRGWTLESIRFVTSEASRRPQMAFVSFTRDVARDGDRTPPGSGPRLVKSDKPEKP